MADGERYAKTVQHLGADDCVEGLIEFVRAKRLQKEKMIVELTESKKEFACELNENDIVLADMTELSAKQLAVLKRQHISLYTFDEPTDDVIGDQQSLRQLLESYK